MKPNHYRQDLLEHIGNKLYHIRHSKKEKIISVARGVGVSHPVISKIENGRYKGLSIGLLCKIADHYKVNVEHILTESHAAPDASGTDIITLLREENRYLKAQLDVLLKRS